MLTLGQHSGDYWAIFGIGMGLLTFGTLYHLFVAYLERTGWASGKSSILVAIGTAVTVVAAAPVIGWTAVALVLFFFVCSGLPMLAGQLLRTIRNEREFKQRLMRGEFEHADHPENVAEPRKR